ncbi:hypothetical protein HYY75_11785 [bacterium]|nr:hypothetical protein [bacterium]
MKKKLRLLSLLASFIFFAIIIRPQIPDPDLESTQNRRILAQLPPAVGSFPRFQLNPGGSFDAPWLKPFQGPYNSGIPSGTFPFLESVSETFQTFHSHHSNVGSSSNFSKGLGSESSDLCWGPCKQAFYQMALASGTPISVASVAAMDPSSLGFLEKTPTLSDVVPTEPERIITTTTLSSLIKTSTAFTLLDARNDDLDDGRRIPGAKHILGLYSLEEVKKLINSEGEMIIVYGNNLECPSPGKAKKILKQFGYYNVIEFREGIQGWAFAGYEILEKK